VLEPAKTTVRLREVRVELLPLKFPQGDDARLVKSEFQLYHRSVLRRPGPSLDDETVKTILSNCQQAGVEPGHLILAALLAHRVGGADRKFYARMLVGPSALKHLETYRQECAIRYGTFDANVLGDAASLPPEHNISKRLRASEELAARTAVNIYKTGETNIYGLYEFREGALDPWWLATEPSYEKWRSTLEDEEFQLELARHRKHVQMASKRAGLMAVVHLRNALVKDVALAQAARLGLSCDIPVHYLCHKPTKLWRAIAAAAVEKDVERI